jgi:hypothetical protein
MNFFQKLFNKSSNSDEQITKNTTTENLDDEQPSISKALFVDEEEPSSQIQEELKESKLKIFLDTNFATRGYNDGYEFRSSEILHAGMKKIKSEFRFVIDQMIAEKNAEIFELKNHKINVEGVSDKLGKQLENRILEIQGVINKIEKEKTLSIEDEGMVMVPVHNYHDGFIRGVEMYQQEKIFATSTGLFN